MKKGHWVVGVAGNNHIQIPNNQLRTEEMTALIKTVTTDRLCFALLWERKEEEGMDKHPVEPHLN